MKQENKEYDVRLTVAAMGVIASLAFGFATIQALAPSKPKTSEATKAKIAAQADDIQQIKAILGIEPAEEKQ